MRQKLPSPQAASSVTYKRSAHLSSGFPTRDAKFLLLLAAVVWGTLALPPCQRAAQAQDSSLYHNGAPLQLHHGSWTHVKLPPPKELKVHDIVNVRVDKLARTQSEGSLERRKNMLYDAVLSDWVHLIGLKALKPNAQNDGDQRIRGQLQRLFRAEADNETRESLAFEITCTIADIRPNGTLVLEGHEQIQVNDESWEVSLSGICRREDIGPDNTVLSKRIHNLKIKKRERGAVRDGYRRGWFTRLVDEFHPF